MMMVLMSDDMDQLRVCMFGVVRFAKEKLSNFLSAVAAQHESRLVTVRIAISSAKINIGK